MTDRKDAVAFDGQNARSKSERKNKRKICKNEANGLCPEPKGKEQLSEQCFI